jgi:hypothetical protein
VRRESLHTISAASSAPCVSDVRVIRSSSSAGQKRRTPIPNGVEAVGLVPLAREPLKAGGRPVKGR